jgi:hypothetical protein
MLIHVTITVQGTPEELARCEREIRAAFEKAPPDGELNEQHGGEALRYDLKVRGGIPFPIFATVSRDAPAVTIMMAWVNPDAGQSGAATLQAGRLMRHDAAALKAQALAPVYVRAGGKGRLDLAFAVTRITPGEYRGYVIDAGHDAIFRVVREANGAVELLATDGAPQWELRWRGAAGGADFEGETVTPSREIPQEDYGDLERLAQAFVAEWIWLAGGEREETAVEHARCIGRGHTVFDANLRSAAWQRLQQAGRRADDLIEYSTLSDDFRWIEPVLTRCWLSLPAAGGPPQSAADAAPS